MMVCNVAATTEMLTKLDQEISGLASRPTRFSGENPSPVLKTDKVAQEIHKEVAAIHAAANAILSELDALATESTAHKEHHMVAWANSGFPDGGEDIDGIELGEKLETALARRRQAVEVLRARHLRKLPTLVDPPEVHETVDDPIDVLQMAMAELAKRRG